ncbi:MAG: glycosyltransferase [Symploca sp. SIO2G7]|nr:glycosyltransferase [Symploca sp. SIO2G7]
MPLISVIIPAYNAAQTILETVDSVLHQTVADFELIVINDGSQDTTLELISGIKDPRLQVISYPNAGLAVSRNRGVARARGTYISFIDADDLWTPDKLELQLQALKANPEAAVAYSWTDCIDKASNFLRPGSHISVLGDVYAKLLLGNFLENGSNALICKQALIAVGGFDESLPAAQDWDLYLRLAINYQFVVVPSPQVLYRISTNSMSSNVLQLESASLQVIDKAFAQAPATLQHLKKYSLANLYSYLTFKAVEGLPQRQQGLTAARFLWQAVVNNPSLLQARVLVKLLFKIAVMTILPTQKAKIVFTKAGKLSDVRALLGYMYLEPDSRGLESSRSYDKHQILYVEPPKNSSARRQSR